MPKMGFKHFIKPGNYEFRGSFDYPLVQNRLLNKLMLENEAPDPLRPPNPIFSGYVVLDFKLSFPKLSRAGVPQGTASGQGCLAPLASFPCLA